MTETEKEMDSIVFIGGKPFMNYVTAVVMQLTTKKTDRVVIKARGKFISRAVDVAEVSCKKFLDNAFEVSKIIIDSADFKNQQDKDVRVSTIELVIDRKS